MTRVEVIKLLQFLRGCYPSGKIDDPQGVIDAYMLAFSDKDAGDVYKAARYYMLKGKYFPNPADLSECMSRALMVYGDDQPTLSSGEGVKMLNSGEEDKFNVEELWEWLWYDK